MRSAVKEVAAALGELSGLSLLGFSAQNRLLGPMIRAVNYHDVPAREADRFREQVKLFSKLFDPVGLDDLRSFVSGEWRSSRPGLIVSFDDGLATHAEVAAPILEEFGFVGWFMVPTGFIDSPVGEQIEFARQHSINLREELSPGKRIALDWSQVRDLAHRHVVGSHTVGHVRFRGGLSRDLLSEEAHLSKRRLEEATGCPIEVFAWVGGEEQSYSREGAESIAQAGFEFSFMTNSAPFRPGDDPLAIQRTNIESNYSIPMTKLCLSGLLDVVYARKRARVNRLTRFS